MSNAQEQPSDRPNPYDLPTGMYVRLEMLTRRMLTGFPTVARRYEPGDVLHGALLRLMRAIRQRGTPREAELFPLASTAIWRELMDLARRAKRIPMNEQVLCEAHTPGDDSPAELDKWQAFHEQVAALPALEREVVSLRLYHGWTEERIAGVLQVTVRTVKRHWRSALRKLSPDTP
jgi:RNA polymerase sigma factor (sigma-70 family)